MGVGLGLPYCVYMSMSYLRITEVFKGNFTKTRLYNFDALQPHFYIVKLGFTGVYNIILISALDIYFGYSLEPPHHGGSIESPQSLSKAEMWKNMEKYQIFFSERSIFVWKNCPVYLYTCIFVLITLLYQFLTE